MGDSDAPGFSGDRASHGRRLLRQLKQAVVVEETDDEHTGTYVTFISFPGLDLALKSLDSQAAGSQPELVAVSEEETSDGLKQLATVFIPAGKISYFIGRLTKYIETSGEDKASHAALIEGVQAIQRATIHELWTDPQELFPPNDGLSHWWEVWLRKQDGLELQRFTDYAAQHGLLTSRHFLGFGDRTVVMLRATTEQLALTFDSLDDIAELRRPHDVANFLTDMAASDQSEWVNELLSRLSVAAADAPAVCILDTGVQDGHPLLEGSLKSSDIHVADPAWQKRPVDSHGTEMAGLALFGDLQEAIAGAHTVQLKHGLESVKILPDIGGNDRDLYGAVTARSVDRPEIEATVRPRVFMLAVTAPRSLPDDSEVSEDVLREAGKPTSWSASIDALSYGRGIDDTDPKFTYLDRDELTKPRLFVISAGNIRDIVPTDDPLVRSDIEPIEDPAQAWNALTVGAYTDKDDMSGAPEDFRGYSALASRGQLAPVSRTSVAFDRRKWPVKPDVVAEGGNVAVSPASTRAETPENLAVLTTRFQKIGSGALTTTRDTSAATATVASIAANIMADYPAFRPETVRALVVHSADWTTAMQREFEDAAGKTEKVSLLRRYGMGVPSATRALYSASDALTMISESTIRPYEREGNSNVGKAREMNLHALPWPKAELDSLGHIDVRMRVTLSYFVEPNPSSRGWTGRYAYPSHGLRFAVRRPEDSIETFRKRINKRARDEGEKPVSLSTESGWFFGAKQQQSSGSLHTDIWTGPAAELASKEAIAVYPVAGWWKDRAASDQSNLGVHYSLVVSIESPSVEIDLWTPVAQQITREIQIQI